MKTSKTLFRNFGQKPVLFHFITLLFLLFSSPVRAQYGTYSDGINDHIYTSVGTIPTAYPSFYGAGYVTASTTLNQKRAIPAKGEINRYQATGSLSWSYQYTIPGAEVRFNYIEVFQDAGQLRYFVAGSVKYPSSNKLLVAVLDDNGNLLSSNILSSAAFPHLLGTSGTHLSDGNFGVTGVSSTGFLATDKRNITVFKLDPSLNIMQSYSYSSPTGSSPNDYDSPSDVVEGATPDEFFITLTCNPGPSASTALIDMTTGNVIWSRQWTGTAKSPGLAVNAVFDPGSSSIWVLFNEAGSHGSHLVQEDYATGNILVHRRFNPALNCYGYNMKRSLYNPDALIIGGYGVGGLGNLQPFMLEYNTAIDAILWADYYTGSTNGMRLYNENNWLKATAAGPYGYYYNQILDYNTNGTGYVLLDSDSSGTGTENIRLWRDISLSGENHCGTSAISFTTTLFPSFPSFSLDNMSDVFSQSPLPIIQSPVSYTTSLCSQHARSPLTEGSAEPEQFSVSPNPASDRVKITFPESISTSSISVYDLAGRKVFGKNLPKNQTEEYIPVSGWTPGIYLIHFEKNGATRFTQKVVIR